MPYTVIELVALAERLLGQWGRETTVKTCVLVHPFFVYILSIDHTWKTCHFENITT